MSIHLPLPVCIRPSIVHVSATGVKFHCLIHSVNSHWVPRFVLCSGRWCQLTSSWQLLWWSSECSETDIVDISTQIQWQFEESARKQEDRMCAWKKKPRGWDQSHGAADLEWQDQRTSFWRKAVCPKTCKLMSWRKIAVRTVSCRIFQVNERDYIQRRTES